MKLSMIKIVINIIYFKKKLNIKLEVELNALHCGTRTKINRMICVIKKTILIYV